MASKWTAERAKAWQQGVGEYIQGVNFIPSTASNQIEMWHSFDDDTAIVQRELEWAADLGYNGLRVFLHDQLYTVQGDAFLDKVDRFLDMAWQLNMRTILVLLEGIWDPHPDYRNATAVEPRPRVHNSRWLQSPGRRLLEAPENEQEAVLKPYVQAVIRRFGNDAKDRVLMMDLFDQPENDNRHSYGALGERVPAALDARGQEMDALTKAQCVEQLVPRLLDWVRSVGETAVPVTIAAWEALDPVDDPFLANNAELFLIRDRLRDLYLSASDVITFHNYDYLDKMMNVLSQLRAGYTDRPIVCSSYMARESGSTFNPVLGRLYRENVWAFNWGFVAGKTQTIYNATTWNVLPVNDGEPVPWHHDVLRDDGSAYLQKEREYLLSYRPRSDNKLHPPKPEAPLDAGKNQSFLFMDVILIGMAVVLLGAIGWLWRRRETSRERQQFALVEDLEDSFVADLELRPMD